MIGFATLFKCQISHDREKRIVKLQEFAEIGGEEDALGSIEVEKYIGKSHIVTVLKNGGISVITKNVP